MSAIYTATSGHTFTHVCFSGPLCEGWADIDDDYDADEAEGCDHGSCHAYLYEGCEACYVESMDEYTREEARLALDEAARPASIYAL